MSFIQHLDNHRPNPRKEAVYALDTPPERSGETHRNKFIHSLAERIS
jgi:hypothetical protein